MMHRRILDFAVTVFTNDHELQTTVTEVVVNAVNMKIAVGVDHYGLDAER